MIDFYLKFKDEAEAVAVLYNDKGANYANIDTIGIIYQTTDEIDTEGNPIMSELEGWHVNVRVVNEDPTPLEQYAVIPTLPVRVWG